MSEAVVLVFPEAVHVGAVQTGHELQELLGQVQASDSRVKTGMTSMKIVKTIYYVNIMLIYYE